MPHAATRKRVVPFVSSRATTLRTRQPRILELWSTRLIDSSTLAAPTAAPSLSEMRQHSQSVRSRMIERGCRVLVRWKGYSSEHDTWEPADSVRHLPTFKLLQDSAYTTVGRMSDGSSPERCSKPAKVAMDVPVHERSPEDPEEEQPAKAVSVDDRPNKKRRR